MTLFFRITVLVLSLFFLQANASENDIIKSVVKDLNHSQFSEKLNSDSNVVIIDVRTAAEYAHGHVPDAINIPHDAILKDTDLLEDYKNQDMIFYCRSGYRASKVTSKLIDMNTLNGRTVFHLEGDMNAWSSAGLPIEK